MQQTPHTMRCHPVKHSSSVATLAKRLTKGTALSGISDLPARRWDEERVARHFLALVAGAASLPVCYFAIRSVANFLAEILPERVSKALFPSTPNPTGGAGARRGGRKT